MTAPSSSVSRQRASWMALGLFVMHNAEEVLTIRPYLRRYQDLAPAGWEPIVAFISYRVFVEGILAITIVGLLLVAWAVRSPRNTAACWWLLLLQSVVFANVWAHVVGAAVLRSYVPGLATAVACNLPFSIYLLRRAWRERWVGKSAFMGLLPAALLVHGPGLVALLTGLAALRS